MRFLCFDDDDDDDDDDDAPHPHPLIENLEGSYISPVPNDD